MQLTFHKGINSDKDLEEIHLLDKLTYGEKYLLSIEEYKQRIEKNPDQLFIVRNSQRVIVGYISMVPINYDTYIKIKNGETDKEVITPDNIIGKGESIEYVYWDSIIVDPVYRKYKIGKRLVRFALKHIIDENTNIKKIIAHCISKGGINITKKYGLEFKRNLDKSTTVMERVLSRKSNKKKVLYKDKNKRQLQRTEKYLY